RKFPHHHEALVRRKPPVLNCQLIQPEVVPVEKLLQVRQLKQVGRRTQLSRHYIRPGVLANRLHLEKEEWE
ncbi:hypothetical protein GCK32_014729, partial [Trichostrongylus colubriformis]